MAAQPTGPPARWRRGFANANLPHPDLDFRGKSLQTLSAVQRPSRFALAFARPLSPSSGDGRPDIDGVGQIRCPVVVDTFNLRPQTLVPQGRADVSARRHGGLTPLLSQR